MFAADAATSRRTIASRSSMREHRRLGRVGGHADDQPVDQVRAAPDDVHMAERDRIERARIDADAFAMRRHQ